MRALNILLALACTLVTAYAQAERRRPFKVGMLLPLSGTYAELGEDNRQGIDLALADEPADSPIIPIYVDSRADPIQSVNEFRKLTTIDHADAVFAFRSPVGMAVRSAAKAQRIPLLGGVGHKDFTLDNEYAFQLWPRSDREGMYLLEKIVEQGHTTIALLTTEDDWTASVSDGVRAALGAKGARLVFDELVTPSEADFRTIGARIKEQSPDAILINLGISQIGPAIRQLRELRITTPLYSNFFAGKPEVLKTGKALDGVKFVEMDTSLPELPAGASGATLSGFVATKFLTQAAAGAATSPSGSLYEAFSRQTEVRTKTRSFPVKDRCVEFPMSLKEIRDGKVHRLQ